MEPLAQQSSAALARGSPICRVRPCTEFQPDRISYFCVKGHSRSHSSRHLRETLRSETFPGRLFPSLGGPVSPRGLFPTPGAPVLNALMSTCTLHAEPCAGGDGVASSRPWDSSSFFLSWGFETPRGANGLTRAPASPMLACLLCCFLPASSRRAFVGSRRWPFWGGAVVVRMLRKGCCDLRRSLSPGAPGRSGRREITEEAERGVAGETGESGERGLGWRKRRDRRER